MILPTLFKQNKNSSIQSWSVWTENNVVFIKYGILNGTQQISKKIISPKNIGSSNETSPSQQAEKEALSLWNHKKNRCYSESISIHQYILPMLASIFEDHKHKLSYPVDVQPKLDGCRCLAYKKDNKVVLVSRGNKFFNLPHLQEQLSFLPYNLVLDGELYLHNSSFQEISHLVKSSSPIIQFWVYDSFIPSSKQPWSERKIFNFQESSHVKILPTYQALNEQEIISLQTLFVSNGFEGAIIRSLQAPYLQGFRSHHLLKLKSFQDHDYQIVSFTNGKGKFQNSVIWICLDPASNQTFSVVPKASLKEKENLLLAAPSYIGQFLKVKFFDFTDSGLPRFPIGLSIRPAFDMPE